MTSMAKIDGDPEYLLRDIGPDGVERLYVRKRGRDKIRIKDSFGTPAFWQAYTNARKKLEAAPAVATSAKKSKSGWAAGTLGWLAEEKYFESEEYKGLDQVSQSTRRGIIRVCLQEPLSETDPERMGHCPLKFLTPKKIKRLRDLKSGKPGAANNRKKYLSAMFGYAIETELMSTNPARDVRRKKYATDGFHTWTEAEVATYERHYPIGTQARLALALYLYLGVRKSDAVRLGPKHVHEPTKEGEPRTLRFVPKKTDYKRARESVKPILPELERILSSTVCGEEAFLETGRGDPFTANGFGNKMREWCDAAGLPACSSHGLRKVGATRCAAGGATEYQMMALFDWDTPAQAATYIKEANRKRMTMTSAHMLETPRVH